jgi:hypothetical protein
MKKTILFIDHVGYTVVAEELSSDEKLLVVKNPAVLQAMPNQQNQLQVQLLPVLYREFVDSSVRDKGVTFSYPKNRVVMSDADLDQRLKQQYDQMFNPSPIITPEKPSEEVIKLFDE